MLIAKTFVNPNFNFSPRIAVVWETISDTQMSLVLFNPLLGVWISVETLLLMFHISLHTQKSASLPVVKIARFKTEIQYSIDQDKVGMGRTKEVFRIFKIALLKAKSRNHFPMAGSRHFSLDEIRFRAFPNYKLLPKKQKRATLCKPSN